MEGEKAESLRKKRACLAKAPGPRDQRTSGFEIHTEGS